MKKVFLIFMAMLMTMSILSVQVTANDPSVRPEPTEEECAKAFLANQQLTALEEAISDEWEGSYPFYYAGCYLDDEYNPVVKVTRAFNEDDLSHIIEITGNPDIKIEYGAENSYFHLLYIRDEIRKYYYEHCDIPYEPIISSLSSVSINVIDNCVDIGLLKPSEDAIYALKRAVFPEQAISDMDMPITFAQEDRMEYAQSAPVEQSEQVGDEPATAATSYRQYSGKLFYVYNQAGVSTASLSIGFPAKLYTGNTILYGFITAGHDIGVDDLIKDPQVPTGEYVGECTVKRISGTVDAAFVHLTNREFYDVMSAVNSERRIAGTATLHKGDPVYRYGGKSYSYGWVWNESDVFKETFEAGYSILLTDLIHTGLDLTSKPGDSGGPLSIRADNGNYYVGGILIGSGTDGECYFTKVNNIMREDQSGMDLVIDVDR